MTQRLFNRLSMALLAISLAACASAPAAPITPAAPNAAAQPAATAAPATTVAVIPTTTIIKAYQADQAAADAQYQGQTLRMSGKVTNINDVFGTKAVLLRDSANDTGLQCYLSDAADADTISIGQTITIEGTIKGGDLGAFMVAEPCQVIKA